MRLLSYKMRCIFGLALSVSVCLPLAAQACSLQFTTPAKGITVSTPSVSVAGAASGFANTGDAGSAVATVNGTPFFSYSGTFTTIINFLGSGSATAPLQPGANLIQVTGSVSGCSASDSMVIYYSPPPPVAQKNGGAPIDPNCTNPVNGATGNKFQEEIDYAEPGTGRLEFKRYYNSTYTESRALGKGWRHTYDRQLTIAGSVAYLVRPDGQAFRFTNSSGNWIADNDIKDRLAQVNLAGVPLWQFVRGDDNSAEYYDSTGRLSSITDPQGRTLALAYNTLGLLLSVTDSSTGRALQLAYDPKGRLATLTDPLGGVFSYQYGDTVHLTTVTYPVTSGTALRQYIYNEPAYTSGANLPDALTGITDENGDRYASYTYDAQGRGIATEHGGGNQRYTLAYNADGSSTVTDPLGAARTYAYQTFFGVKRKISQSQPPGAGCSAASSSLGYDANGNVSSSTDFNGNTTTTSYDLTRNLETQRIEAVGKPEARTVSTQWHGYWRAPVKMAGPQKLTTWVYNGDGGVYCAPSTATVPGLNGLAQPIGVVCQRTEQATTDANGSLGFTATATGTPRTWTYTYNSAGQVLTVDGPRTDVLDKTTYIYYSDTTANHALGDLASITNALGHTTQFTSYGKNGLPLTVIDANSVTLTFNYTPRGWLKTSRVAGQTTVYDYDAVGQLTGITRPDASKTTYGYDAAHRLTSVSDTTLNTVSFTLDAAGNVLTTTWSNPNGSTAKNSSANYDALGRLQNAIATRNAVNYTTAYGYDANGNRKTVTDPKSQNTSTQYDVLNRPTQITDALTGLTTLAYDARDQITQVKAPNNAQTSFTVDGLSNVTREVSADRGTTNATYDAAGNLLTRTDARGLAETRTWDALNRPLTVSYPSTGENQTYTWDSGSGCSNGVGRLCQVADNGGSTAYAYDARGNIVSETRNEAGHSFTTQYSYDGADRVATVIAPTGKLLSVQRDSDGKVQQLSTAVGSTPQVNLVSNVTTDAAGNLTAQNFGNGVNETRTFNTDGSVANQTDVPSGSGGSADADVPTLPEWGAILLGVLLFGIGYRRQRMINATGGNRGGGVPPPALGSLLAALIPGLLALAVVSTFSLLPTPAHADETLNYDANGNVITRTLSGATTTYDYDALDRVKSEAGPAKTQTLTHDANGNRLSDASGNHTYTASTDRQLTIAGQSVTLDAAGHITQARGLGFVWNQAGQLKEVHQSSPSGTLLASYFYDYQGRRSRKVTTASAPQGAATILYFYDRQDHLMAEMTPQGNPLITYVWRDEVPVSVIVHGSPEVALYLETDHLDTPIAARDQTGTVVWKWESDAFGSTLPNEDPGNTGKKTAINLRFPGQYFDKESGLHYNWNRYYDPTIGRYMSSDPIGLEGGINTYGYVGGNPQGYSDPTGQIAFLPGLIGGGIGAMTAAMGYNASGASGSMWQAVAAGAIFGAAIAYVPASWGGYAAMAAGGFGGFAGNVVGQYTNTGNLCSIQWQPAAVQGGIGVVAGLSGYGGAGAAGYLNMGIPGVWNASAVAAGTSGLVQLYGNLPIPSSYGGLRP